MYYSELKINIAVISYINYLIVYIDYFIILFGEVEEWLEILGVSLHHCESSFGVILARVTECQVWHVF